ncbi:MAG: rod shape-determining protein MreD [Novosphingobium sp.]
MIHLRPLRTLEDHLSRRINRAPSPAFAIATPWVTVMLGSLLPAWPYIASAPVAPPLGLLLLLAWRQGRPGLLPVWAGFPLGAFDDIYSGQPFGSAILLWSLALIAVDVVEARFPWRNFAFDWLEAAVLIPLTMLGSLLLANAAGGNASPKIIIPQMLLALLLYPMIARGVALCDRVRLLPLRRLR